MHGAGNYLSKKSSKLGVFFRHVHPWMHDFGILDKSEEMDDILTRVIPSQVMSPSFTVALISPSSTLLSLLLCVSLRARMSGAVKSGAIRATVRRPRKQTSSPLDQS